MNELKLNKEKAYTDFLEQLDVLLIDLDDIFAYSDIDQNATESLKAQCVQDIRQSGILFAASLNAKNQKQ